MGVWELEVKSEFSAAHFLRNYQGKCEHLHGHNYGVRVIVSGSKLNETQLVMDFKILKNLLKATLEKLDHQHLNEVKPFLELNPSSENLAKFIWDDLRPALPEAVQLVKVTVAEKDIQSATYYE